MKDYKVHISNHIYESRNGEYSRKYGLSNEYLYDIIKLAINNGLTSFRNKGTVKILVKTEHDLYYTLLIEVKDHNINIITILFSKFANFDLFPKVHNKINLIQKYRVPEDSLEKYRFENLIYKVVPKTKNPKLKGLKVRKKHKSNSVIDVTQDEIDEFMEGIKRYV